MRDIFTNIKKGIIPALLIVLVAIVLTFATALGVSALVYMIENHADLLISISRIGVILSLAHLLGLVKTK